MFLVEHEKVPLCLDCYSKYSAAMQVQTENYEREMNYLSDQVANTFGLPLMAPRYPARPAPNNVGVITLHNIKVTGGVVGSINTGAIGKLDVTISAIKSNGDADVADAISKLSEAILKSESVSQPQKDELVEILSGIASEAATPPESRRNSVAKVLLGRLKDVLSSAADLTTIWQQWGPAITAAFAG
jgi:hypothetical protein